jgi:cell envelope opacity-associated protein A
MVCPTSRPLLGLICHVRLAYQPPANSTFLSKQTIHQQSANQNKSTPVISHQPNEQTDNWQHIHNNLILPVVNPPLRSDVPHLWMQNSRHWN